HAQEIDGPDAMLLQCRHVRRQVAACEQSAMNLRVKRLYPPIEHFGEVSQVADSNDLDSRVGQRFCGASGRNDLDALIHEPPCKLDDSRLIRNAQQRAANRCHFMLLALPYNARRSPGRSPRWRNWFR